MRRSLTTAPLISIPSKMGKTWVLDTGTKGTGAEMVPLEKVLKKPAPGPGPAVAARKTAARPPTEPEPRPQRLFKVIDVMSRQVLAENADTRATMDLLSRIPGIVDVRIYTWQPRSERWRLLTLAEQRAMWELRDRSATLERASNFETESDDEQAASD
jgi:hypothetical protein